MKALRVTQIGKINATFIVKDKEKIKFYKKMADAETMTVKTIVEEIII